MVQSRNVCFAVDALRYLHNTTAERQKPEQSLVVLLGGLLGGRRLRWFKSAWQPSQG